MSTHWDSQWYGDSDLVKVNTVDIVEAVLSKLRISPPSTKMIDPQATHALETTIMTHNDMSSFLEQLVEAKAALDREPALKQRILDLEDDKIILDLGLEDTRKKLDTAGDLVATQSARIATLEAELAQSRFQASSAMEKLSAFKGLVGSTIFGLSSAVSEAETSSNEQGQSADPKSATSLESQSPTAQIDTAAPQENVGSNATPKVAETSSGIGYTPGPFVKSEPISPSPTASSSPADAPSNASGQEAWQAKPHAGKSWWLKPAAMTWGEWVDGDGCEPNWAYSRELK